MSSEHSEKIRQEVEILTKGSNDFVFFVNNIFSKSEKNFIHGEYIDDTARFLSQNNRTARISARHHFKSFSFYAYFMWKLMYEGQTSNIEAQYFSFNADLAAYHIGKIKNTILANPYFDDIIDLKPTAESVLKFSWDNKHFTTLAPHGLVQFKRGIHADLIFIDDPFQDPENELNLNVIYKINEIFKSNILDMPKEPDGELHIAGTPQTSEDFFFDKNLMQRFKVQVLPAITDEDTALWPEWMDIDELKRRRKERGKRVFSREYMCTPVYSTKGFFDKDEFKKNTVNENLVNLKSSIVYSTLNRVVAGFDIGKKSHPSHLAVFEIKGERVVMIHHKFMDEWAYSNGKEFYPHKPTQLEYLKQCITNFNIKELYYDDTRGEFEVFAEQGLLPKQMIPQVFTTKLRNAIATAFHQLVERSVLMFPNDDRLINQICSITESLQAIKTKEGHADSFWSTALAMIGIKDLVGFSDNDTNVRRTIKTGSRSLFSEEEKVPKGW